jgi:ferrous-iron efflux pump FieF
MQRPLPKLSRLSTPSAHSTLVRLATFVAILVAMAMIAMKSYAYLMTSSVSVLSSLMDSVIDAAGSIINAIAVYLAFSPADQEHRFGHGKAEALAALGQSLFITFSAAMLVYNAVQHLWAPDPLEYTQVGIWVMVVASILTFTLVQFQRYVKRMTNSLAIESDSLHYQGDLIANIGVMITLGLSYWFHIAWLDPLFALGVSGYLIYGAWHIGHSAFDVLMDRELSEEQRKRIMAIILAHPEVLGMHDLRTRSGGYHQFVQFHLELDQTLTLLQAHRITLEVEEAIRQEFPTMDVIIHEDPRPAPLIK